MKFADLAREIVYPLTQPVMALALVFFSALLILAARAGIFGLFLLLVSLPAYARYLLAILEARIHGRQPEPPTIEMFSLVESFWTLFPLVPVAALVWLEYFIIGVSGTADGTYRGWMIVLPWLIFVVLMPASLTILTMTRSPIASINPLSIYRVIRRSMPAYLWIPLLTLAPLAVFYRLSVSGVPSLLLDLGGGYLLFLFCSLTGAVMHGCGMHREGDIPEAAGIDQGSLEEKEIGARKTVASHAYGFISRGNRDGGLRHIRNRIDAEEDVDQAWQWFFDEMMRWESSDAVLYFAQPYISRLLRTDQDAAAIRVLTRCLHRNPRFRPLEQDRDLLFQMLTTRHRKDLLAQLES